MSRPLETHLRALRAEGRKGLIPFVSAGDPDLETTRAILIALAEAGSAAIEVGIPFSDPIADGPVIQASSQRALAGGTTLPATLEMLASLRGVIDVPLVLFSYLNPIDRMGFEAFGERAAASGATSLLLTDAPPGTEPDLEASLAKWGLDRIVLVAPTTPESRLPVLAAVAEGFVYVIGRRGVTGVGATEEEAPRMVSGLREHTDVPVYVGFGVRSREDVVRIHAYADGAIVGSALVELLHSVEPGRRPATAAAFVRGLLSD